MEILILTLIGIIVGFVGGLLGGGADVLIVPLLLFFGITTNIKTAIGTSLAALLPPIGIFAVYQFYKNNSITKHNIYQSFYIALCFTIASYYSSKIAIGESKNMLKKLYAVFLIIIGIISFKY
tara:strand:- start:1035 stop:1403 length:369 start_codon:yes stop_codon:yes gene_type:complete